MKNIQAQYQDLLEGKMSKSNFMRNVRMQFPQHVAPTTSFDDSVKILKGKRILSEAKKPEGVYGHNPNAEMDEYRRIDHLNYYQVYKGIQFELAKMPEITDENYIKVRKKVVDKILKDPDAYKDLQLANFKAVKEMDKDLEMKQVKKDNLNDKPNEMKVVKKDEKGNTEDTLGKKEKKKAKNGKGLDHMTQTPKGKLEAFATPGKEKVLKEAKEDSLKVLRNLYYFDKLGTLAAKEDVDEKHHKGADLWSKKGDTFKKGDEEYNMILKSKRLRKGTDYDSTNKVEALKEHILDEMTNINPTHEYIGKGARVKKKDNSKAGEVTEFDGDTATVKWDDGSTEHVQMNVITKKDVPNPQSKPSENPFAKMANLGDIGQNWLSGQIKEDPVGQQAAGNPEEEAEMKASKIKALREKLVKALKKESGDVVRSQDGTVLAVTPSGQGQTAARGIRTQSKGGINPVVTTISK